MSVENMNNGVASEPAPQRDNVPVNTETNQETKGENKRTVVEYGTVSIDYGILKNFENSTLRSFSDLVHKVILIDGKPFGQVKYINSKGKESGIKLTEGRKNDFLRLIESYAIVEFIGIKCHIVKVFDDADQRKLGDFFVQKRIDKMKHS